MKIKLPVASCRLQVPRRNRATRATFNLQPSTFNRARAGIALVITLIMLSVTLVMALAFLAVSRRERNSVNTTTDTATARLAADAALAAAQAQIAANILASTNVAAYSYGLLVSTTFINGAGFQPNNGYPTNVSYNYANGNPVTGDDLVQNIANLWLLPRAPVFIKTNALGSNDFRFYLDLNRDGRFEGSGVQPQFGNTGNFLHTDGSGENNSLVNVLSNSMTGDPEWIGVLEHPDQPHGPNNHFIARYAFAAVPVGNTLDLNAIHNNARRSSAAADRGFFRNQGVGSWEINLAAFLADLNTNQWFSSGGLSYYDYEPGYISGPISQYRAFDDALTLINFRYGGNYSFLASANNVLTNTSNYPFNIDEYSDGPWQTTVNTNANSFGGDTLSFPWPGADNTNKFFSLPSDLFGANMNLGNFPAHLSAAGNGSSTYDRYTFYRMLDQLGTDTAPESGKLNLNYSNAVVAYDKVTGVVTNISIVAGAETNLVPWRAQDFFLAAADQMLKRYTTNWYASNPSNFLLTCYGALPANTPYIGPNGYGLTNFPYLGMTNEIPAFGVMNIPVRVNGYFTYTPAINRVLQLAANLYDASTNSFYPSVFRPLFEHDVDGNVFIVGYTNLYSANGPNTVIGPGDLQMSLPLDVASLSALDSPNTLIVSNGVPVNVYGVPWIIGAKKGLPGLNQFSMVNAAQFTRKLQVVRDRIGPGATITTNQMVVMSITNNMGISFWNSYTNYYQPPGSDPLNLSSLSIIVHSATWITVTNSDWGTGTTNLLFTRNYVYGPSSTPPLTRWPGSKWTAYGGGTPDPTSFFAWQWANTVMPTAVYNFTTKAFNFAVNATNFWDTSRTILDPLPQFGLLTTNWLQAYIVDGTHVIDYVQLRGPINNGNLNSALKDPNSNSGAPNYYLWVTNIFNSGTQPSWGIVDQMDISSKNVTPPASARWKDPGVRIPGLDSIAASRVFFGAVFTPSGTYPYKVGENTYTYTNSERVVQAPYTATRIIYLPYLYQVNDPLVHYTVNDLDAGKAGVWFGNNVKANGVWGQIDDAATSPFPTPPTTEIVNGRYQPWGRKAPSAFQAIGYNFGNEYNLIYKDPLVWGSDYWDFPTNKYPAVGWIGRVHRGTPWQTVYLKAHNVLHTLGAGVPPNLASGTNTWAAWTGDYNNFDAANSGPLQDRMLFDLFTAAPNENATRGQLSVNQTHLAAWSALFSGMVALTNSLPDFVFAYATPPPSNSWMVIQPAGVGGIYSALGSIVTNINNMRAGFTNLDGVVGTFEHKGDILSVTNLTENSPFLNWNSTVQKQKGISDEVYEWLPQQMMSLLTCPSAPRYVVYCYGQTLKPAQDGLVTSSKPLLAGGATSFGLVTNYQVVAESAARAVIRVDRHASATGTNYTTTMESYNPLPPD